MKVHRPVPAVIFSLLITALFIMPSSLFAHCQIPCGIYDDNARVKAMLEDVVTIEKSIKMMGMLAGKQDVQSQNQMVRWINNKEEHAQKIMETMADYFLAQRVKPSQEDYAKRLAKHHAVILAAMKAKQSADMNNVPVLRQAVEALVEYYPFVHSHSHE